MNLWEKKEARHLMRGYYGKDRKDKCVKIWIKLFCITTITTQSYIENYSKIYRFYLYCEIGQIKKPEEIKNNNYLFSQTHN